MNIVSNSMGVALILVTGWLSIHSVLIETDEPWHVKIASVIGLAVSIAFMLRS
jgi:uncharacterized membrane protein YGL010W